MEMRIRRIRVWGLVETFEQIITYSIDNLITGDETWVHLNTPEAKRDSMTWKHQSSPVTKTFKVQRSAAKVMASVLRDAKGVILIDIFFTRSVYQCCPILQHS
ncbi:transposase [Elysia marginata]|uniref:Transposase n=1 Tax=Elysia marginata TaxID=1093978 RepID=A0AAV4EEU2_9GAST|nr:transposase [Elysia marginata]